MNKHFGLAAFVAIAVMAAAPAFAVEAPEKIPHGGVVLHSMVPHGMVLAEGEKVDCGFFIDPFEKTEEEGVPLIQVGEGVYMFALPGTPDADYGHCGPAVPFISL